MVKEKRLLKKTSSLIIAIFMLFSFAFNFPNDKVEASDMASYVRSLIGTPAKEWGSGTGTQCVELPKYYIENYFGLYTKTLALGNGNEMYKIVSQTFSGTFQKIDYYNGFVPQPGDIISYHSSSSPAYGHAAIVYEVSGNTYKIAEQWNGSNTVKSNTKTVAAGQYGVSYTIIGVARPKNQTTTSNDTELKIPYPRPTGNPNLQNGSSGDSVKWLQYALNLVNNAGLTVDGQFGSGTQQAVVNFQRTNGLTADGIAGPATISKIVEVRKKQLGSSTNTDTELGIPYPRPTGNPNLQNGSSGDSVKWLQYALNLVNNAGLTVDGQFGSGTKQAVINFQRAYGLDVDGIAGPATINKIVAVRKSQLN